MKLFFLSADTLRRDVLIIMYLGRRVLCFTGTDIVCTSRPSLVSATV